LFERRIILDTKCRPRTHSGWRFRDRASEEFAMRLIKRFLKDESAATAIEYGLIATGIALAIIPVITGLGTKLKTTFSSISTALK
jgi:pilus assembly protein Flp/PilA